MKSGLPPAEKLMSAYVLRVKYLAQREDRGGAALSTMAMLTPFKLSSETLGGEVDPTAMAELGRSYNRDCGERYWSGLEACLDRGCQ